MLNSDQFPSLEISTHDQVTTVRIRPIARLTPEQAVRANLHWELGEVFSVLRGENGVRVVVLTGAEDGSFLVPPKTVVHDSAAARKLHNDPARSWTIFTGIV